MSCYKRVLRVVGNSSQKLQYADVGLQCSYVILKHSVYIISQLFMSKLFLHVYIHVQYINSKDALANHIIDV